MLMIIMEQNFDDLFDWLLGWLDIVDVIMSRNSQAAD